MKAEDLHHLTAAYALDAVTPEERRLFESHYPNCEICSREVAEFRETAAILAEGTGAEPPPDLKQRVMADVTRNYQLPAIIPDQIIDLAERRRQRLGRGSMLIGSAAALVVALFATVAAFRSGPGSDEVGELLATPDAIITTLEGDGGTLRIVWSEARSELAIVGAGVEDPGPELTYELWFVLEAGGVAPAGLFRPDEAGDVGSVLRVGDTGRATGFGVTIEPAGGSDQPTSEILYVGSV